MHKKENENNDDNDHTYENDLSTPANWQPGDKYLKTSLDMEALKSNDWLSEAIVDRVDG